MPSDDSVKMPFEYLELTAFLFKEKSKQYGNNYLKIGHVLAALWPQGLTLQTPEDWNRMHLLIMQLVKFTRYCENWTKVGGHPDSIDDLIVYAAMLRSMDAGIKQKVEEDDIPF